MENPGGRTRETTGTQLWWDALVAQLKDAHAMAGSTRVDVFECAIQAALVEEHRAADREHADHETPAGGDDFQADFQMVSRVARKWLARLS